MSKVTLNENNMIRLNVGAGPDLRPNYTNVDIHSKEEIEDRYGIKLSDDIEIQNYDILNLPYEDNSVDEIMCLGMLEHLSFEDEGKFFDEAHRVLKVGGLLHFTVPDFENLVKQWLNAKDNFKEFYKISTDENWFGNGDRNINNRWGYLTASIFGNQDGNGQFHRNAYTLDKILRIMKMYNYTNHIYFFNWKDTEIRMIGCKAWKQF